MIIHRGIGKGEVTRSVRPARTKLKGGNKEPQAENQEATGDRETHIGVMPVEDLVQLALPRLHHAGAFALDALHCATRSGTSFINKLPVSRFPGVARRTGGCKRRGTSPSSHPSEARIDKRVRRVGLVDLHRYWMVSRDSWSR